MSDPPPQFPGIRVVNVVCNFMLGITIDRRLLALHMHAMFDGCIFKAITSKCLEAGATNVIFSKGKQMGAQTNVVGASTVEHALYSAYLLVACTNRAIVDPRATRASVYNFRVVNSVSHTALPGRLDTARVRLDHPAQCSGIAERFVAVRWQPPMDAEISPPLSAGSRRRGISFQLFDSGRVVVVGLSRLQHIHRIPEYIRPLLQYMYTTDTKPINMSLLDSSTTTAAASSSTAASRGVKRRSHHIEMKVKEDESAESRMQEYAQELLDDAQQRKRDKRRPNRKSLQHLYV